ncbi:MAG: extracellular solute-binding protein [Chloroflexota bacterium]|nr:extracellular solute-binding protein [Chloroflexota bacterium]
MVWGSALAGAALAACGQEGAPASPAAQSRQPATIGWFKYFTAQNEQQLPEFLAEFKAAAPHITVDRIARAGSAIEAMQKLTGLVAAGTPPDLYSHQSSAYGMVSQGLAEPLDDLIQRDKFDTKRFTQLLFEIGCRWQGKTYGLPYANQAEAVAMIYHRGLLRAAGVPEPPEKWGDPQWTWQAFTEAAKRVHKMGADGNTAVHGVNRLGYYMFFPRMWDAAWITEDYKTITADKPEVIEAYRAYFDLDQKHRVWPRPEERTDFRQQNVAFSVLGAWELREYGALADLDWAFAPFPKGKVSSPQAYVLDQKIVKGSKNREPAWTFTRWLTEKSPLAFFEGRPPALREDVGRWASTIFKDKPTARAGVVSEGMNVATTPELIWFHPRWAAEMSKTVEDDFWKPVGAGQKTVDAALKEIKPRLQQVVGSS